MFPTVTINGCKAEIIRQRAINGVIESLLRFENGELLYGYSSVNSPNGITIF